MGEHDDIMKWKHFPRNWLFVWWFYGSPVTSPHKGQWRGVFMFFCDLHLNQQLNKQWIRRWFEMPLRSLWRHCNVVDKWYVGLQRAVLSSNDALGLPHYHESHIKTNINWHFLINLPRSCFNLAQTLAIFHHSDAIKAAMESQITSLAIVYSTVKSGTDQRKHQSSASLAFVRGIHRWPVNSPHKCPVTRNKFPFDDVITLHWDMIQRVCVTYHNRIKWDKIRSINS